MTFACGAAEALASLATEPFDVVVSDLRMPGMDGLELLEQIRAQHPAMVRVLLSGQGPSVTFDDALLVAHQYLAKPCDPALLRTAIERTAGVRAVADDPELQALVGQRVTVTTRKANVLAASCQGDVDCGQSDEVDLVETITAAP